MKSQVVSSRKNKGKAAVVPGVGKTVGAGLVRPVVRGVVKTSYRPMKVRDAFPLLSRSWRGELELRGKEYRLKGSSVVNEEVDVLAEKKRETGLVKHAVSLVDRSGELNRVGEYRDVLRGVLLKKGDGNSADGILSECDAYLRVHGLRRLRTLRQQSSGRGWKDYFLKRKGISVNSICARQSPSFLYYLALDALLPMREVVQVKKGGGAMQVPRPLSRISVARRIAAGWLVDSALSKSKGSSSPRYGAGVSLANEVLAVVSDSAYRMEVTRSRGLRGVVRSALKSGALGKKMALYRLAKANRSYRVGNQTGGEDSL